MLNQVIRQNDICDILEVKKCSDSTTSHLNSLYKMTITCLARVVGGEQSFNAEVEDIDFSKSC